MILPTSDGSYTLYNKFYQQTYHSHKGALAEAKHVYLEGAGVYKHVKQAESIAILEVGFGTGLNFFLTADICVSTDVKLVYKALDKNLLEPKTIQLLSYTKFLSQPKILDSFVKWLEHLPTKPQQGNYLFTFKNTTLNLCLGEATEQKLEQNTYDAIYLDGFSPDVNPELWSVNFLENLYRALKPTGKLSSYCVKGEIRRRMQALNFKVKKCSGPPNGKKEMLIASH